MDAAGVKKNSNLRTRLIAAGTLLPLILILFVWGGRWIVVAFLLLCLTLSVGEMAMLLIPAFERRLAPVDEAPDPEAHPGRPLPGPYLFPGITVALGWAMLIYGAARSGSAGVAIGVIALAAMIALLIGTFSARSIDVAAARAFGILISLAYGALPWLVVVQLYDMAPYSRYILLVMTVTWAGDTGGYFGGRYYGGKIFGERKLAPVISPKKTWEGAVVGLILSVVGALILNLIVMNSLGSVSFIAMVGLVGGVFAQLGDLVESTFKRFSGVKDSGVVIPGHGGFLDRVDGILFAAPVIWAIVYYFK